MAAANNDIIEIPLELSVDNIDYCGHALRTCYPGGKVFTCDISGLDLFMFECRIDPVTRKYMRKIDRAQEYNYLIGQIEEHVMAYMDVA